MLLFDLHGVPRPSVFSDENEARWRLLVLSLAFVHVPGLQFEPMPGRPKTWGDTQCLKLYVDVMIKVRSGMTESQACLHLARIEPWCSFIQSATENQKSMGKTLRRKVQEMREQNHSSIEFVKQMEERWPNDFDNNLQIVSQRFSW